MFKKIYIGICMLFFIVAMYLVIITCKPVKQVKSDDVAPIKGIVEKVEKVRDNDIQILLKGDQHNYYINNAAAQGVNFDEITQQISGKEVTLYYIKRWTPLTTDGVYPHISKIKVDEKVLFNELIDEKKRN